MNYTPEGVNRSLLKKFYSVGAIKAAVESREIFEGRVTLCDSAHNLWVDLGGFRGIIPRSEGALGILEGETRDIALISKVNRTVCFRIMGLHRGSDGELLPVLSRRNVQLSCKSEYIDKLRAGDIITARVTRLEGFGAFIDIGCGLNSLIPIDMLSVSRISHPRDRLSDFQIIRAVLKKREPEKLTFSVKELLGTWEENVSLFECGETVTGIVRGIEPYGVFVELTPNLAGLAEYTDGVKNGQPVSVFIKSFSPARLKVKLSIVEAFGKASGPQELRYFISGGHIDEWRYSPPGSDKQIYTKF
ncbi:MAG: S1 RNA-binding domain-containing protein [Eubacterium sp.]|nr:S1 RNA-binding domain-containing protein [Eubacterium sp.]